MRFPGVLPAFAALLLSAPASAAGGGEAPPSYVKVAEDTASEVAAPTPTRSPDVPPPSGVSGSAPAASSSSITDEAASDDVTFTRALIPDPPTLGVPFRYEIRFQGPPGTRLFFPPNPSVGPFHLDGVACSEPAPGAPRLDVTCTVNLRAFRLGRLKLPVFEAAYTGPGGGGGSVSVPGQAIEIQGTLGNDSAPALHAAYPPLPIRERNWPMIIAAVLLATVAVTSVLTLLAVLILRRWILPRRFEKPKTPAHVVAFGRLEALRPTLASDEPGRDVFFALSEILREYLGNRYDFEALELTTREVMQRLAAFDLQGVRPLEIEDVLSFADLVKFAKQAASKADAIDVFDRTHTLVERTLYVPAEKPEQDLTAPEYAHAPVLERVAASAVDLALPFPLLALGRLALPEAPLAWVLAAWGATLTLWLVLRDVAGPASPGHRLFGLRLLDERLDLLASRRARLVRNVLLALPLIGWTIELLVLAAVTRTQRVGDQWARTSVAVPAHRARKTGRALVVLVLAGLVIAANAWLAGR